MSHFIYEDEILYGSAYYYEYLPIRDRQKRLEAMQRDFDLMKKAGLNTIRIAESTWSTWEPEEGKFDFSDLVDMLELSKKNGLHVIIGTPSYAIPAWLYKKHPEIMGVGADGRPALYGHRQSFYLGSKPYQEAVRKVDEEMMKIVKDYDHVIGFQIDNETHHQNVFNPELQEAFVEFLKERYGDDLDAFNRDFGLHYWSNAIASWDDFPALNGSINAQLLNEFEKFRRKMVEDFWAMQIEVVDQYRRPDQFVTQNFDFGWTNHSYGIHPEINQFSAQKLFDVMGGDIYHPSREDLTGKEISFDGHQMYAYKKKPYLILETQAMAGNGSTPLPGQLELNAIAHIANGSRMVAYWPFAAIHHSKEAMLDGLVGHDRKWTRILDEATRISKDFKKLQPVIAGTYKKAKVALLMNKESQYMISQYDWMEQSRTYNAYNDMMRWMADVLYEMNIPYTLIDPEYETVEDLSQYDLLIASAFISTTDAIQNKLRAYVEQGGHLLATFKSFQANERIELYMEARPYKMTDVFGLETSIGCRPTQKEIEREGLDPRAFVEEINPTTAVADMVFENGDTEPVLYRNQYGKGVAWYLAAMITSDKLKEVIRQILMESGIQLAKVEYPIVVERLYHDDGHEVLFVMNFSDRKHYFNVPENAKQIVVATGEDELPVLEKTMSLHPWQALVFELA